MDEVVPVVGDEQDGADLEVGLSERAGEETSSCHWISLCSQSFVLDAVLTGRNFDESKKAKN